MPDSKWSQIIGDEAIKREKDYRNKAFSPRWKRTKTHNSTLKIPTIIPHHRTGKSKSFFLRIQGKIIIIDPQAYCTGKDTVIVEV